MSTSTTNPSADSDMTVNANGTKSNAPLDAGNEKDAATIAIQTAVEKAKRAFALRKYEQAVEHYATALDLTTKQLGDDHPETADLYFSYGKALLENAITQSSVLGKEQGEEPEAEDAAGSSKWGNGAIFFSGDGDDQGEDEAVDLLEHVNKTIAEAEAEAGEEEEAEDAEPEDDFNAAWEVLDLARAIYDKQVDDAGIGANDEVELKLADTYINLGDVSLETEKFDQAITDYEAGLALKRRLLPHSSRQIAEVHYKLSMVLDLTPGRLQESISHAEKALESVEGRLAELRAGLAGELPPLPAEDEVDKDQVDIKGKGKATTSIPDVKTSKLVREDAVQKMAKTQIESELKELSELREDVALKVEELKTQPSDNVGATAPALAAQELDWELNIKLPAASTQAPAPVNDLTSMVKKKKKNPEDSSATKRKAEGDAESSPTEKKLKLDPDSAASIAES
ncbi:hypothetical protein BDN72DRAFT_788133 [Pluteus cervinus]|uniref:Uncharacterized protein n=1 Tax=Pluteus cervinus TaxID=181527 RepID=A0ACD3B9G7_9AGAR|nr:hypothetical protein BDN72DRAFT_788133 [Pluteus cervinus]